MCPNTTLTCEQPIILEGECCPTCKAEVPDGKTRGCVFDGDKKFHGAGTTWHPFVPPFGFNRCVTCICQVRAIIEGKEKSWGGTIRLKIPLRNDRGLF